MLHSQRSYLGSSSVLTALRWQLSTNKASPAILLIGGTLSSCPHPFLTLSGLKPLRCLLFGLALRQMHVWLQLEGWASGSVQVT